MPDPRHVRRRLTPFVRASVAVHAVGAVACLIVPRGWPWFAGGVLANHLMLVAASLTPRSTLVGPNLRRLDSRAAGGDGVVLTFDDGPDPAVTPRVLDCLEAHGATATFFCVGLQAEKHPALVEEIARRGHGVENHSWRHAWSFCFQGPASIRQELERTQQLLGALAGSRPRYFRAPAGLRNPWLDSVLSGFGLELVSWTRRAFDTVTSDPDAVVKRLSRNLAAGDILLLHDRRMGRTRGRSPAVLDALPRLLDRFATLGLRAIPLPRPPVADARV